MMTSEELRDLALKQLEDMKAKDIKVLDVRDKTSITDIMVVATGTSARHVKSLAEAVAFKARQAGNPPLGVEGLKEGEWALVDLNSVILHVMQSKVRDYYQLERLWSVDGPDTESVAELETEVQSES